MVRRLLPYPARFPGVVVGAVGCMLVLALATSALTFLVGPAFTFLLKGGADGMGKLLGFIPALARLDRMQAIHVMPLLLIGVGLVKGAAYFGQYVLSGTLSMKVAHALRTEYFAAALKQDPAFFSSARTGDLLARLVSDVTSLRGFVAITLASLIRDTLSLVFLLGLCVFLDWRLSLVAFAGLPLVAWPIGKLAKKLKRRTRDSVQARGRLASIVQEGIWGIKVIQSYRMEARELTRFDAETRQILHAEAKAAKVRSLTPVVIEIVSVLGLATVLKLATDAVLGGSLDPERLLSFLAAVGMAFQPARELGRAGNALMQASVGSQRIFEVIDRVPAITAKAGALALPRLERELVFEGVDFAYGERQVLFGLDLSVRRGETVALVGESGAGKSTAALLAMRFADPMAGCVRIDGVDLRDATPESVRAQFGLVTQESFLFAATIAENIALARPEATLDEIVAAARTADADGFISAMPEGYRTPIGERGVRLSGGQKQRIALARALLCDAPVLLLDEATSNLDPESEREVAQALAKAMEQRTSLVIAHRLSTIRAAHRVVVLKQGRVVEEGRHDELMRRGGEYARLYAREAALEGERFAG